MHVQDIVHEDFVNYKKPSLFIGAAYCSGKCGEACQNKALWGNEPIEVSDDAIIRGYLRNPLTKAIVFGGLEPFDQWDELRDFIWNLRVRYQCYDDIVIYTGYNEVEINAKLMYFRMLYQNIIVKCGRYIPDRHSYYDENLGVYLASDNQYSIAINKEVDHDN